MKRQDEPSQAMADLRDRHLDFYLDLMTRAEGEGEQAVWGQGLVAEQRGWAEALEAEQDNLRAAINWALDAGQSGKALDIAAKLAPFWEWWGRYSEGRRWLERSLAVEGENHAPRAKALSGLASIAFEQGDYSTSGDRYREAANAYKQMGNELGVATGLVGLGRSFRYEGREAEAIPFVEEAIATLRTFGPMPLAFAIRELAWCHEMENSEEALRLDEEAIQMLRDAGDRSVLAGQLADHAYICECAGDLKKAARIRTEMIAIFRELGDKMALVEWLREPAGEALNAGNLARAQSLYEEQLLLAAELADANETANALSGLAQVARARGDFESARKLYTDAIAKAFELSDPSHYQLERRAAHLGQLGGLLLSLGLRDEAKRRWLAVLAINRTFHQPTSSTGPLNALARIAEEEGDVERAIALREEALAILRDMNDSRMTPHALLAESGVLRAKGDDAAALVVLEHTLQTARDVYKWVPAVVGQAIGHLLHKQGKDRDAAARLEEAMDAVPEASAFETHALMELLAAATAAAGDLDRAFEVLKQLGWRRNFLGPVPRVAETLAKIKAARGEWEAAARLIGAAEVLRSEVSRPLPEWEREAHESCVLKVREALGPVDFETAVDQGRESGAAREIEEALA